jgi:hypothetical protein
MSRTNQMLSFIALLAPSFYRCSIAFTSVSLLLILLSIHPALPHNCPLMAHHRPIFILKRDD